MIDSMELTLNCYESHVGSEDPLDVLHQHYDPINLDPLYKFIDEHSEIDYSLSKTINGKTYNNRRTYRAYENRGIKFEPFKNHSILLTINGLHNVLEPTDNVSLYSPQDEPFFFKGINEVMDELNAPHIETPYWQVKRVDYCINVPTPHKQLYIDLLNKSRSKAFQNRKVFDGKSCYLQGKDITINIYSKHSQLLFQRDNLKSHQQVTEEDLKRSEDILRYEIQCRDGKVDRIKEKFGWKDRRITNYLDPSVATYILLAYAKQFFTGNYHTAYKDAPNNAFALIDNAKRIHPKTKTNMQKIVANLAKSPYVTLDDTKRALAGSVMGYNEYDNAIKALQKINVNPIPIPKRKTVRHLDSVYDLVDNYISSQKWGIN